MLFTSSSKARSCKVMQGHAKLCNAESCNRCADSCNATLSHATSRKVMQCHARSCKVMQNYVIMQGKSHTPAWSALLSCRDVSPVFRLFRAVEERWLFTTGGLRNLNWFLLCCFVRKQSFVRWTFRKSNFLQTRSIIEREGAWSTGLDWGHLVLPIGLSRSSGLLFVSDGLYPPCRSSQ